MLDLQQLQIELRKILPKIKPTGQLSRKDLNTKEVLNSSNFPFL